MCFSREHFESVRKALVLRQRRKTSAAFSKKPLISSFFFCFILLATLFSCALFALSYKLANQLPQYNKISAYECGFLPFEDARDKFDIKFYIVAILFVIFDLEITYLFPWAISFQMLGVVGFINMLLFLLILTLGFVLEWERGILDW